MLTYALGFVAFDQYKALLQDTEGKISGPRTVIAGFGAGVTESLLAVTPFESIKTTLSVLAFAYSGYSADRRPLGLMTGRVQTLECAVSSTLFPSSPASAAYEVSSKASCPRPPDKQLTALYGSDPILSCGNLHNHTLRRARNSVLCQLSELVGSRG